MKELIGSASLIGDRLLRSAHLQRPLFGNGLEKWAVRPRPFADSQVSPYLSVSQIRIFELEYLEAAVRDLTDSAITCRWRSSRNFCHWSLLNDRFTSSNLKPALTRLGQEMGRFFRNKCSRNALSMGLVRRHRYTAAAQNSLDQAGRLAPPTNH